MGGLVSTQSAYSPSKKERVRDKSPSRNKRSSVMRPVLRLEVQPQPAAPVDRHGFANKRTRSQRNVARLSSNEYDHLRPASRSRSSTSLLKTDTFDRRSSGRSGRSDCQSMVVVQYIDNGQYHQKTMSASMAAADDDDDDDYDHLFPLGEYEHLCDCTYARVDSGEGGRDGEEEEAVWEEPVVRERITDHCISSMSFDPNGRNTLPRPHPLPNAVPRPLPDAAAHRRAKSIDELMVNRTRGGDAFRGRRQVHSISDADEVSHWSLGESVMKTLTESGLQLFNIEHPTHESELEINRTWPKLRSKLELWRQSQQTVVIHDDEVCVLSKMGSSHPKEY